MWGIVADWVGALGSAGALFAAVVFWRKDRSHVAAEQVRQRQDHLRRITAGLKAEIAMALEVIESRQETVGRVLLGIGEAKRRGLPIDDRPMPPRSMTITDGVIYQQVAAELGLFPADIVHDMVAFYGLASEIERIVSMGGGVDGFAVMQDMAPRLRMSGAMLAARLRKLEAHQFSPEADTTPTQEEVLAMAREVGYPLDAILRERGLERA